MYESSLGIVLGPEDRGVSQEWGFCWLPLGSAKREDLNLLEQIKHLMTLPRCFVLTPVVHGLGPCGG